MISVSYLKSNDDKKTTIQKIDQSIADMIHVDLMDGLYAGEKNFTTWEVINDFKDIDKPLDIHLMVNNPKEYISELAELNVKTITIHLDILDDVRKTLELIKDYNILAGIALNPQDNEHLIDDYLDIIDYVLVMSVNPGQGGQKFIPVVLNKLKYLNTLDILIGIDGGINSEVMPYLRPYKVDNIISGSFVCMSDDYDKQITLLKSCQQKNVDSI